MSGTDKNKRSLPAEHTPLAPAIILVRPQLGENIGMCARAMLNCAVTELRIVSPRDGWPSDAAVAAASGAAPILDSARLYGTVREAVADLAYVFAATARGRDMVKAVYTAEAAARKMHDINRTTEAEPKEVQRCGVLFGPERAGLDNDEVALASAILNIPLNPGFSSLNLAQAVLLVCHTWLAASHAHAAESHAYGHTLPATKEEIELLMEHLTDELEKGGFFRSEEKKPTLVRNIRNFFFRSGITQQEVNTLHGVFACLTGKKSWK